MIASKFYLRVRQVEQHCLFDLSWGGGQRLPEVKIPFPQILQIAFQQWRLDYLQHYNALPLNPPSESETSLRGKLVKKGSVTPPSNTHSFLVGAQETLLVEFHDWLRRRELHEIRAEIAKASRLLSEPTLPEQRPVELLITCDPIDLARLPWETWEIGAEYATTGTIRIARVPTSVRSRSAQTSHQRSRPRILAIIGDDRNLDLKVDQDIMGSLAAVADIQFVRRKPEESTDELKTRIVRSITQDTGWDMLFFAGHSSETNLTGGEIEIAPGASIQISEIKSHLETAQQRGLQVAVFNSCEGLSFAESLIDLGLNQVVVMREKVHNRVAQAFLLRFCQSLTQHKDIHESLITASQFLKTEKNLTYPSGYLLPSLFRHPEAELFYIPSKSWHTWLKRLKPKRHELIAVAGLSFISLLLPVQQWLLDQRVNVQARLNPVEVRQSNQATFPPVLLVQIDDESITQAKTESNMPTRNPIPQAYLAKIVRQLAELDTRTVGVDYLLDSSQTATPELSKEIEQATAQGTRFVFIMTQDNQDNTRWIKSLPEITASHIHADLIRYLGQTYYMPLLFQPAQPLPFAYWLAWFHEHCVERSDSICQQTDHNLLYQQARRDADSKIPRFQLHTLTAVSYEFYQQWFHPITDFSLPPQEVYTAISAQKLLQQPDAPELRHIAQQAVMIVPAYPEAGIQPGTELFIPPAPIAYWYTRENAQNLDRRMTSGEHHAYLFNHFLHHRLVVPVPDLPMILIAALTGKIIVVLLAIRFSKSHFQPQRQRLGIASLLGATALYTVFSLWLYASPVAILLPIILPTVTMWIYVLPVLVKAK